MPSSINPLHPTTGAATTQSVRENFAAAKAEIEALQSAGIAGPQGVPGVPGIPGTPGTPGTDGLSYSFAIQNLGLRTQDFGANALGVFALVDGTAPTTSPIGVGQLYQIGGALYFRGSNNSVTLIAPA